MNQVFEWDQNKNNANLQKHGISFDEAREMFFGPVYTWVDDRFNYGEMRKISIGRIGSATIIVVTHTDREGRIRIISARKAKPKERLVYYEHIEKTNR